MRNNHDHEAADLETNPSFCGEAECYFGKMDGDVADLDSAKLNMAGGLLRSSFSYCL